MGGSLTNGAVTIVEVSPRDGLQDEPELVATETKVELIQRAIAAGARRIEATSFAHPERVPQMADAEAVLAAIERRADVSLAALVLNQRGLDRAIAAGVDEINVVAIVTDGFSMRNQGFASAEALAMSCEVTQRAREAGLSATVTLAAAFGCPIEGRVDTRRVLDAAAAASAGAPTEICLADTIGAAVPSEVADLVRAVGSATGLPVRIHLHNSRNTGYANALAAIEAGAVAVDASIGGIGGCPFAPGATGNVATEDLVYLLEREGITTGMDLDGLIAASQWLAGALGHDVPGQVARTGAWPPAEPSPFLG